MSGFGLIASTLAVAIFGRRLFGFFGYVAFREIIGLWRVTSCDSMLWQWFLVRSRRGSFLWCYPRLGLPFHRWQCQSFRCGSALSFGVLGIVLSILVVNVEHSVDTELRCWYVLPANDCFVALISPAVLSAWFPPAAPTVAPCIIWVFRSALATAPAGGYGCFGPLCPSAAACRAYTFRHPGSASHSTVAIFFDDSDVFSPPMQKQCLVFYVSIRSIPAQCRVQ